MSLLRRSDKSSSSGVRWMPLYLWQKDGQRAKGWESIIDQSKNGDSHPLVNRGLDPRVLFTEFKDFLHIFNAELWEKKKRESQARQMESTQDAVEKLESYVAKYCPKTHVRNSETLEATSLVLFVDSSQSLIVVVKGKRWKNVNEPKEVRKRACSFFSRGLTSSNGVSLSGAWR